MKKSDLIAALAAIPGDPEILVQGAEMGYDRLNQISMVTVQQLDDIDGWEGEYQTPKGVEDLQDMEKYVRDPRTITAKPSFEALAIYRGKGKRNWI